MQKQMVPARGLAQSGRHHLPKQRILNPAEADGLLVIRQIITRLLGRARKPGQTLYFGVPAPAFGVNDDKFTFHETTLRECLRELGYEPKSISEGLAVVYGELGDSNFTGIGVSCGGGMCNVCLAYLSVPVISFSVAKAGDYIDYNSASAIRDLAISVRVEKERGFRFNGFFEAALSMHQRQTALGAYYRHIARRKDGDLAVFATARKLATLIYRLLRWGQPYADEGAEALRKAAKA